MLPSQCKANKFGNFNPMLFRDSAVYKKPLFKTLALACLLEPTNSCANAVHMKTFPASDLKVLIWVLATSTKICSIGRFQYMLTHNFYRDQCVLLLMSIHLGLVRPFFSDRSQILKLMVENRSRALVPSIFRADWFGRWVVTHSLAGFNFHDHRPAVKINQHLLWWLMSKKLGTLTQLLVHPTSPVLLTKSGPQKACIQSPSAIKSQGHLTDL